MLYRGITQVSVVGLRGTMHVEKARDADGVSVDTTGPYEAQMAGHSWLVICPEGHEVPSPVPAIRAESPITAEGTHVGSVDAVASVQFGGRSGPRRSTRASGRSKAKVRITAPAGTHFELVDCHGVRKGPGGWRLMEGTCQFTLR